MRSLGVIFELPREVIIPQKENERFLKILRFSLFVM